MQILKNGTEYCEMTECLLAKRNSISVKTFGKSSGDSMDEIFWSIVITKQLDTPKAHWSMKTKTKHYRIINYQYIGLAGENYSYIVLTDFSEDIPKPAANEA